MIKFIKAKIAQLKKKKQEKKKLKNMQQYYLYLRYGALFLQYINDDLEKGKGKINRHARRRWEKEISKSGKFSREMVEFYSHKVEVIKMQIDSRLNPPKKQRPVKPLPPKAEVKKEEAK